MKVQIDVTEEDIKNGRRGIPSLCPVALAVKRTFGRKVAMVGPCHDVQSGTWWSCQLGAERGEEGWKASLSFDLGKEESSRASTFDHEGTMDPHSFTVEI
jgi:hypothetical protein